MVRLENKKKLQKLQQQKKEKVGIILKFQFQAQNIAKPRNYDRFFVLRSLSIILFVVGVRISRANIYGIKVSGMSSMGSSTVR